MVRKTAAARLMSDEQLREQVLGGGWQTLNPLLPMLSRQQVAYLIRCELISKRRLNILERLLQRLGRLDHAARKAELLKVRDAVVAGANLGAIIDQGNLVWLDDEETV